MKNLSEQARKLRNEYQRKYRQRNPEKIRQYNVNYWEKLAREGSPTDQVKNLSSQGLTQREIAAKLDVSLGFVNKCLKE